MTPPSSRNLSYDFPVYKGLTLRELRNIVLITTVSFCLLFTFAGSCKNFAIASGCIGFLCGFIVSLTLVPKPIAYLKSGKPQGYLTKVINQRLTKVYLTYRGLWQKGRYV